MNDDNRFDDNEENFDFDDFDNNSDDMEEFNGDIDETEFRSALPIDLISRWKDTEFSLKINEINHAVLKTAIRVAEESWFWRLRPLSSKIHKIVKTYYTLNNSIDNNNSPYTDSD